MTTAVIHQPEYFPWLGFLDKARRADVLVILDSVQFDRTSLQHRARVLGANGPVWLTIPFVHRFPQRIDEVAVADDRWPAKHWKTLQACYGRAPGFKTVAPEVEALLQRPARALVDLTIPSVETLLAAFGIRPARVVRASELNVEGEKSELVLALCHAVGATRYLSGRSGATYLDAHAFAKQGIELMVQRFRPPTYSHAREPSSDIGGLSALDAWFNLGDSARTFLMETSPLAPEAP